MSSSKKVQVPRAKLQAELKQINKDFQNQFPGKVITRGFWRSHSQYGKGDLYESAFGDWDGFRDATLGVQVDEIKVKPFAEPLPIDKRIEIEKEKISSKTGEWKKRFEHETDRADKLQRELDAVLNLKSRDPELITILPKVASGESESVAVVLLSDWHSEEKVTYAQTSSRNQFSLEICTERVKRCFEGIQRLWEINNRDTHIKTMVLALLGDFITGSIHEDLAEANNLAPSDAIYFAQNLIYNGIKFLLDNTDLEEIIIPCHSGNHGRMTKDQRHATEAGNSLERYMYFNLRDLFAKEPRVRFQIADGYHSYVDVFGNYKIRFHHGHNLNYKGGAGGITIPVNKAINEWNKLTRDVRLDCFGHFHQRIDGGNFVANGSIIGYNAYATSIKAAYERPAQMFFLINKKYNEKTITAPIFVTKGVDKS